METADLNLPTPVERKSKFWTAAKFSRQNGVLSQLPDALFGDSDPDKFYQREKPVHRQMQMMALKGFTVKEIAEFTGHGVMNVSRVLRQPFARTQMIQTAKRELADEMKEFLDGEVMPTLSVIKDIRDRDDVKAEVKLTAANMLLDRRFGRPTQPVEERSKPLDQMSPKEVEAAALKILERERTSDPSEVPGPTEVPREP